jgi:hypothetical protein
MQKILQKIKIEVSGFRMRVVELRSLEKGGYYANNCAGSQRGQMSGEGEVKD